MFVAVVCSWQRDRSLSQELAGMVKIEILANKVAYALSSGLLFTFSIQTAARAHYYELIDAMLPRYACRSLLVSSAETVTNNHSLKPYLAQGHNN